MTEENKRTVNSLGNLHEANLEEEWYLGGALFEYDCTTKIKYELNGFHIDF